MKLDTSKMLTVSTAHIKSSTAKLLNNEPDDLVRGTIYKKSEYGWFIFLDGSGSDEPITKYSERKDLNALMLFADYSGYDILCIDRDGQTYPFLQTYEWKTPSVRSPEWELVTERPGGADVWELKLEIGNGFVAFLDHNFDSGSCTKTRIYYKDTLIYQRSDLSENIEIEKKRAADTLMQIAGACELTLFTYDTSYIEPFLKTCAASKSELEKYTIEVLESLRKEGS